MKSIEHGIFQGPLKHYLLTTSRYAAGHLQGVPLRASDRVRANRGYMELEFDPTADVAYFEISSAEVETNAIKLAADRLSWSIRMRKRKRRIARIGANPFVRIRVIRSFFLTLSTGNA